MAEKGFGVKEINLIGASGTPTIESPNNLNLNAVNVAISTNATIGGNLTVTGTVGIAGTLTYEDVTNIDSVGIITARSDLNVDGHTNLDNVSIVGVATVTGSNINIEGGSASLSQLKINSTGRYRGIQLDENGTRKAHFQHDATDNKTIVGTAEGTMQFNSGDTPRVILNSGGHWVPHVDSTYDLGLTGTRWRNVYADTLYGDGSNITGIAVTEAPVTDYTITANGSSAYRFHGGGVDETANNPDLYLIRGQKYRFNNTTGSGHPFAIREANGGSAYTNGVTGNNQGVQFFTVPYDAPAKIFYQCTIHGGMVGNIYIRGAGGQNTNVGITTSNSRIHFTNESVGAQIRVGGQDDFQVEHDGSHTYLANNTGDLVFQNDAKIKFTYKTGGAEKLRIDSSGSVDMHVGTGEVDIYSAGSGDQLSLRLLNSDASAGNKIGIYFGPANNVAGAYIKGVAESDFSTAANRDAGLEFGTRLNATFLAPLKISASGLVTKPLNPAFNVRGGNMSRTDAGGYICQFNNTTGTGCFDTGGNFDTSTYKFTAPITGTYYFFTNIRLDAFSTGYIRTAFLSTNYGSGATYWTIPETGHVIDYYSTPTNILHISTSTIMNLDKDDEVYVYQDPQNDTSYTVYLSESSFGGYLIG